MSPPVEIQAGPEGGDRMKRIIFLASRDRMSRRVEERSPAARPPWGATVQQTVFSFGTSAGWLTQKFRGVDSKSEVEISLPTPDALGCVPPSADGSADAGEMCQAKRWGKEKGASEHEDIDLVIATALETSEARRRTR